METIVPKKPAKEGQNVVQFNLKGRIPLLILVTNTVSSIFTNNLKLIYNDTILFLYVMFSLCCMVSCRCIVFSIFCYFDILFYSLKMYTKTIIRLRLSDYGEYSPRLRLGEYSVTDDH